MATFDVNSHAMLKLLVFGGYLYFNKTSRKVVAVNAVCPHAGSIEEDSQCFSGGSDSNEDRIYDPASDMGFTRYYLSTDGRCKTCTTNAITKNGLYVIWISTLVFILGLPKEVH